MSSSIKVGEPDVAPDTPSHIKGVPQGNTLKKRQKGFRRNGTSTAERSTGIDPSHRNPLIPGMPNLSPP